MRRIPPLEQGKVYQLTQNIMESLSESARRERNQQKLSPFENGVVGIGSGVIEVTLLQPILYCKVRTGPFISVKVFQNPR